MFRPPFNPDRSSTAKVTAHAPAQDNQKGSLLKLLGLSLVILLCIGMLRADWNHPAEAASPDTLNIDSAQESSARVQLGYQRVNPISDLNPQLSNERSLNDVARAYPIPALERVNLIVRQDSNHIQLTELPNFNTEFGGKLAGIAPSDQIVFYSLNPSLQRFTEQLVKASSAPHVAIVAVEPRSGKLLAIADKSTQFKNLALHADFPAASLFKVVTASAAVEKAALSGDSQISFRGGTYTLERWNYRPDRKKDRRSYSISEALGRSCNPVFGRIALQHLNPAVLESYSRLFGFNSRLNFDAPLTTSYAEIPFDDYGVSRTAAGFGEVRTSPIHAAAFMAGLANGGLMSRPYLIDRVVTTEGSTLFESRPEHLNRIVTPETAKEILDMMEYTTTVGTSRKEFMVKNKPLLPGVPVAAKTGTLSGINPKGLNTWFIAAAPKMDPKIAISVIVVNPTANSKASHLGRVVLEQYLRENFADEYKELAKRPAYVPRAAAPITVKNKKKVTPAKKPATPTKSKYTATSKKAVVLKKPLPAKPKK